MITLITGVPGAGKTLNTLKQVQTEWGDSDRPIYYRGIRELTLPWTEITDEQCREWYNFEDNAVFVIDEIQQVFPRRAPNIKPPAGVSRLDTHRHRGFDFYIITQKPKNFDFEARGYVGRHLHYERAFGREGTRQLEWQEACDDPSDYHKRQEAQVTRIKFDKKFYDVYKSAEVHTHKPRIPKKVWYFVAAIVGTLGLGGYAYASIMGRSEVKQEESFRSDQYQPIPKSPGLIDSIGPSFDSYSTAKYLEDHTPRVDGLDWTAPVYDGVTEVQTFPRPQCVRFEYRNVCKCYSQQATPMSVPEEMCNAIVDGGWFNPYKEELAQVEGRQAQQPPTTAPDKPFDVRSRIFFTGSSGVGNVPRTVEPQTLPNQQLGAAYRTQFGSVPVQPKAP